MCYGILLVGLLGLVAYWIYLQTSTLRWKPGPEVKVTITDLTRVKWTEPDLYRIAQKRVIAIAFHGPGLPSTNNCRLVTDPQTIYQIAKILTKLKKKKGFSPVAMVNMRIVYEDYTEMVFNFHVDFQKEKIIGENWESKELYPVFYKIWSQEKL